MKLITRVTHIDVFDRFFWIDLCEFVYWQSFQVFGFILSQTVWLLFMNLHIISIISYITLCMEPKGRLHGLTCIVSLF